MNSGNTYISNFHIRVYTSSYLKVIKPIQKEHMNDFGRGALDRLHDHVLALWPFELHYLKQLVFQFIFKRHFAQFAFQSFPKVALNPLPIVN